MAGSIKDNPFEMADSPNQQQSQATIENPFESNQQTQSQPNPTSVENPFQQTNSAAPPEQPTGESQPTQQVEPVAEEVRPTPNLTQGVDMNNQSNPGGFSQPNVIPAGGQQGGFPPQQQGGFPPQQQGGFPPQQQGGFPPQQQGGFPPQQQYNPAPPQQGFQQQGNFGGQNNSPKYNIVDMFWMINKKLTAGNGQLNQGEAQMMTIGFNANFNNMRFSFHNIDPNMLNQPAMVIKNCPRLTTINIFSETAVKLLAYKGTGQQILAQERMISDATNWNPNWSSWIWSNDNVTLQTQDSNGAQYTYTFMEEQIQMLEKSLNFMINGESWLVALITNK